MSMDNREAMIAAFNMSYANPWNDEFHQLEIDLTVLNEDEQKTFFKQRNFQQGWQAATAHNRDAVIDDCIEKIISIPDSVLRYNGDVVSDKVKPSFIDCVEALRSLKTNKEG